MQIPRAKDLRESKKPSTYVDPAKAEVIGAIAKAESFNLNVAYYNMAYTEDNIKIARAIENELIFKGYTVEVDVIGICIGMTIEW